MATRKEPKQLNHQPVYYDDIQAKRTVFLTQTAWHNIKDEAAKRSIREERISLSLRTAIKIACTLIPMNSGACG